MFAESGNTLLDVCIFLLRVSNLTTNIRICAFCEASLYSNSYWHYAIRFSQIMNNGIWQPCYITFLDISWMLTSQYVIRKIYTCSGILKNEGFLKSYLRTTDIRHCRCYLKMNIKRLFLLRQFISFPFKNSFSYKLSIYHRCTQRSSIAFMRGIQ